MGKVFIILIVIVVIWSILANTAETPATDDSSDTAATTTIAEINDLSVGYLTVNDYNNGDYAEESIKKETEFTVGVPQYMVVDFKIKTIADNNGGESVKLMAHAMDNTSVSLTIQEAPTGKLESVNNGDGTWSYDLYYTILATKDQEKSVRMILKLVPNAVGDIGFDLAIVGKQKTTETGEVYNTPITGDTSRSLILSIGSES